MEGPEGQSHTAFGIYREVDAPRRLVYTWDWQEAEHQMGETVVTVDFNDLGDTTEVVVVHEGFPAEEARDSHTAGWTGCLNQLEALFA